MISAFRLERLAVAVRGQAVSPGPPREGQTNALRAPGRLRVNGVEVASTVVAKVAVPVGDGHL
jgi:hypothetical protein